MNFKTSDDIFIYRTKEKIYHPQLGSYFIVKFSNTDDKSLTNNGFIKSKNHKVFCFTGSFDGLFYDWSVGMKKDFLIKNANQLNKLMSWYQLIKASRSQIVSEIYCE